MATNKIDDLSKLSEEVTRYGAVVRVLVDHPDQVKALEQFENQRENSKLWSVFIKVDAGGKCVPLSQLVTPLV